MTMRWPLLVLCALGLVAPAAAAPLVVQDDRGRRVELPAPPQTPSPV